MISQELTTVVNTHNIVSKLAENLNIPVVNETSTINKIANTFDVELRNYSLAVNKTISNTFLNTMDNDTLLSFASSYGIYRKVFSNLRLRPVDRAIKLTINTDLLTGTTDQSIIAFKKRDILFSDETYTISVLEDVVFNSINEEVYPYVNIVLNSTEGFTLSSGTMLTVDTPQREAARFAPQYFLNVEYSLGLLRSEEDIEDFRVRVYEATYMANNMATSLISSVVKEVPGLLSVETNQSNDILYPYTSDLILSGYDDTLDMYLIPMIETSLASKVLYSNLVRVVKPKPLQIVARFKYSGKQSPSDFTLRLQAETFNMDNFRLKGISGYGLKTLITQTLKDYKVKQTDITLIFVDTLLSEETFIVTDEEFINIPTGRFLHLSAIEEVPE